MPKVLELPWTSSATRIPKGRGGLTRSVIMRDARYKLVKQAGMCKNDSSYSCTCPVMCLDSSSCEREQVLRRARRTAFSEVNYRHSFGHGFLCTVLRNSVEFTYRSVPNKEKVHLDVKVPKIPVVPPISFRSTTDLFDEGTTLT